MINNAKENLGLSEEVVAFLRDVEPGTDAIGDVMWFNTNEGGSAFGWIGGPYAVKTAEAIGNRDFKVRDGQYQTISNDTAEGARQAIDDATSDPLGSILRSLGIKAPPGLLADDDEATNGTPSENCGNVFCPVHGYGDPALDYEPTDVVFAVFTDMMSMGR